MREVVGPEASVREALRRIAAGTILSQWAARVSEVGSVLRQGCQRIFNAPVIQVVSMLMLHRSLIFGLCEILLW
jgi:hypothetical protein